MSSATGILGRKIGMTQIFTDKGERVPVTVIEAGPCKVLQVKTSKSDGYNALQLGFADGKEKNISKPVVGHCEKASSAPKRFIREIRLDAEPADKLGDDVNVSIFEKIKYVDVTGISKGKGFQGVMKRHGFHGLPASHGCSKRHRAPGGLGRQNSINKGVPKGKRMPGHMGNTRVTIPGLRVERIDAENNILLVKGAVPGPNGGFVMVHKAIVEKVIADSAAKAKAAK
ncbi:MAG TPA: 50S ribosomal protein L3 [Planctomycetota bacterium]|nr:50S ribosomal protein L3 [Planctomycetota bacterium]